MSFSMQIATHGLDARQTTQGVSPQSSYPLLFNICGGEDLTIRELAETVAEVVGYKGKFVQDTSKPDGTMRKVMDVSKIHNLGWKAKINIKEGIKLTYKTFIEKKI